MSTDHGPVVRCRDVPELTDPDMTLDEWLDVIHRLRKRYGGGSSLSMDAGYNNISAMVAERRAA